MHLRESPLNELGGVERHTSFFAICSSKIFFTVRATMTFRQIGARIF